LSPEPSSTLAQVADPPEPFSEAIGEAAEDWHFAPTAPSTPRRQAPAQWGWQRRARSLTLGLWKPQAGRDELSYRQAVATIRQTLPNSRLVMIGNEKGGSGKTPTALILGGIVAQIRSESNVVWDNNEMRGTLGIRAEITSPSTTIVDVLTNMEYLSRAEANIGELLGYLRRQPEGHLVLASTDDGDAMRQIDYADCDRVLQLLQRRFGLVFADTGNNAAADTFRQNLDSAQVLVIPAHPSPGHLIPVLKLIGAVASRAATKHLVRRTILVITSYDGARLSEEDQGQFVARGVRVMHVPADPVIAANGPILITELSEESRRAWTLVAAAVIDAAARPIPTDRPFRATDQR
jgi:MinD-like ATPase involved in chromosome partitioning or flagellar assembly